MSPLSAGGVKCSTVNKVQEVYVCQELSFYPAPEGRAATRPRYSYRTLESNSVRGLACLDLAQAKHYISATADIYIPKGLTFYSLHLFSVPQRQPLRRCSLACPAAR